MAENKDAYEVSQENFEALFKELGAKDSSNDAMLLPKEKFSVQETDKGFVVFKAMTEEEKKKLAEKGKCEFTLITKDMQVQSAKMAEMEKKIAEFEAKINAPPAPAPIAPSWTDEEMKKGEMPAKGGKCPDGWKLSEDGKMCSKAVEKMEWSKEELSMDSVAPKDGKCPEGYTLSEDGKTCVKNAAPEAGKKPYPYPNPQESALVEGGNSSFSEDSKDETTRETHVERAACGIAATYNPEARVGLLKRNQEREAREKAEAEAKAKAAEQKK